MLKFSHHWDQTHSMLTCSNINCKQWSARSTPTGCNLRQKVYRCIARQRSFSATQHALNQASGMNLTAGPVESTLLGVDAAAAQPGHMTFRRQLLSCMAAGIGVSCMGLSTGPSHAFLLDQEEVSTRVFSEASSSVVSIINYKIEGGAPVYEGIGTGVVWDNYGHVATNYHVISKLDKKAASQMAKIVSTDVTGKAVVFDADLVGSDAMHDVAVLRARRRDDSEEEEQKLLQLLRPVMYGSSSDLKVGMYVFAIGNTFGLTKTLSAGVVSGLNRSIPSAVGTRIYGVIQTDAAINAGNSGGPLLDSAGRMVGMNTATFTRSGTGRGSGVNFALPADLLRDIVPKLIVYGNAMGRRV